MAVSSPFPDLKGQAPLRPTAPGGRWRHDRLFLTSKVRLHCDLVIGFSYLSEGFPFPDLKGQAPLRRPDGFVAQGAAAAFS